MHFEHAEHPNKPNRKNHIRAHTIISGYLFKRDPQNPNNTIVSIVAQTDVKVTFYCLMGLGNDSDLDRELQCREGSQGLVQGFPEERQEADLPGTDLNSKRCSSEVSPWLLAGNRVFPVKSRTWLRDVLWNIDWLD
jgi:hypothetical protein